MGHKKIKNLIWLAVCMCERIYLWMLDNSSSWWPVVCGEWINCNELNSVYGIGPPTYSVFYTLSGWDVLNVDL